MREDIRDIENIQSLSMVEILADILPQKVGSLLSINAMREDLSVSHKAIAHRVDILERFYYHFRIHPFVASRIRSLKKEPKLYLWDWSEINRNESARLENMVAAHLLKLCHFLYDVHGYRTNLYFLRDRDGREVDFLVTEQNMPWFAVEVKSESRDVSKNLLYFGKRLKIPYLYQVVESVGVDMRRGSVRIVSVDKFLASLI